MKEQTHSSSGIIICQHEQFGIRMICQKFGTVNLLLLILMLHTNMSVVKPVTNQYPFHWPKKGRGTTPQQAVCACLHVRAWTGCSVQCARRRNTARADPSYGGTVVHSLPRTHNKQYNNTLLCCCIIAACTAAAVALVDMGQIGERGSVLTGVHCLLHISQCLKQVSYDRTTLLSVPGHQALRRLYRPPLLLLFA